MTAKHGTADRWRQGCRCIHCRKAHNDDTRELRRSWVHIDGRTWHAILRKIRTGWTLDDAAAAHGVTTQQVYGQTRAYIDRRGQLDAALLHGRDPTIAHGTVYAYRTKYCRCPDCRMRKRADRG